MADPEQLRILIGRGGWLRVALMPLEAGSMGTLDSTLLGADVLARATTTAAGRLTVTQVTVTHPTALINDVFRRFPFTRLEAALNVPSIADAIRARIDAAPGDDPVPAPDDDELAEPAGPYLWRFANGTVVANVPLRSTRADLILRPYPETKPRLRSIEPWTGKRPDEFYRRVVDVFTRAKAVEGRPGPAQRIAEANGVAVTKVHRWVKEARRRGLFDDATALGPEHANEDV